MSTAAAVAFLHTVVGVDHYLPFIVLGSTEQWSLRRTLLWTASCGVAHVLATLLLVLLAAMFGWAIGGIEWMNQFRGDLAAYILIGFGILLAAFDLLRGGAHHCHLHVHEDGTVHAHAHRHSEGDHQPHHEIGRPLANQRTFWVLFLVFALGPCEALVPLILAPALGHQIALGIVICAVFSIVTISTMCMLVLLGRWGLHIVHFERLVDRGRALAGAAICLSGALILLGM